MITLMLDFDPEVIGFSSQPFWLDPAPGQRGTSARADYFARLADDTYGKAKR